MSNIQIGVIDPEREDAGDGCIGRTGIGRRALGDREGPLDPDVEIEAELMDAALPTRPGEALRGACGRGCARRPRAARGP